jgi:RimJ/RimL family protein N-acetyltransferase
MAADRLPSRDSEEPVKLLFGADAEVMAWHMVNNGQRGLPDTYSAIGITLRDKIIASVVYTRYRWPDIEIGIHSIDSRCCNRRTLKAIFSYPFVQLKCTRVSAVTDPANSAVCHFLRRLGFTDEGRLRKASPQGDDYLLLGMLREECKWVD